MPFFHIRSPDFHSRTAAVDCKEEGYRVEECVGPDQSLGEPVQDVSLNREEDPNYE